MPYGAAAHVLIWISVAACAWLAPGLGETLFGKLERIAARMAPRRALACAAAGLFVLLTRLILLPIWPIPKPYIYDEFGYVLQADTFASGRLTNPTHPLAPFFESIYILQFPSYNAKFFPGQGLVLAFGQMLFDHPWFGVWLSCGVLAAVLCWALQCWLPPGWALFGSLLTLPLCITSYWMNTYWGGAVTAIGGALVLGSYARLLRGARPVRYAVLLSLGCVLLLYTRPFEGVLVLVSVLAFLLRRRLDLKVWAVVLAIGLLSACWLGYYNYRVTGSPTKLPYTEYDRQYPSTPHLNILPLPPPHQFGHLDFTVVDRWEREAWAKARSARFLVNRLMDVYSMFDLFLGSLVVLVPVALFWRNLRRIKRFGILWWCLLTGCVAVAMGTQYYQHYAAPILAVILILTVQGFRYLRLFEYEGKPVGRFLCRAIPLTMLALAMGHQLLRFYKPQTTEQALSPNSHMQFFEEVMTEKPGGHVVFVRYTKTRLPQEEWIYNKADIDNASVVWAQDMGPEENRKLMEYFKGRTFWLLQPDENPIEPKPYK